MLQPGALALCDTLSARNTPWCSTVATSALGNSWKLQHTSLNRGLLHGAWVLTSRPCMDTARSSPHPELRLPVSAMTPPHGVTKRRQCHSPRFVYLICAALPCICAVSHTAAQPCCRKHLIPSGSPAQLPSMHRPPCSPTSDSRSHCWRNRKPMSQGGLRANGHMTRALVSHGQWERPLCTGHATTYYHAQLCCHDSHSASDQANTAYATPAVTFHLLAASTPHLSHGCCTYLARS